MNQNEQQQSRWYITTSIPYVNAKPHIGHALEMVQADVLARYHRICGDAVRFQSGADENALKNVQAAEQLGVTTAALVAQNAARFAALEETLSLSFDDFIRTSSEERHRLGVERIWRACAANGDIYRKAYQGLYCVSCELFYNESELVEGRCPVHDTVPELVAEENYFFRLSRYGAALTELISTDHLRIVPETRKNEVLRFIANGLDDFSISRSAVRAKGWGIPVPDDPAQVIYVWFDALVNYITGPGYADNGADYQRFWCDGNERLHIIGKDIIRFHAIYWPAMLLSAKLPLPTTILVHGFINADGRKMSKTTGNVIDPVALVDEWGVDALRYYLLRKVPTTSDANFTQEEFVATYNADLADQLGNLLQRVVKMVERYLNSKIPAYTGFDDTDKALIELGATTAATIAQAIDEFALHKALDAIRALIVAANKYVIDVAPWKLGKIVENGPSGRELARAQLMNRLYVLLETLNTIGKYLEPFLPRTAAAIAIQLGQTPEAGWPSWGSPWGQLFEGTKLPPAQPLFPKRS